MTGQTPSTRAGLRDEVARAIHRYDRNHLLSRGDIPSKHHRGEADAVLAFLYREWPWLRAEANESSRPAPTACGHGPELERLTAELADYDERAEQQKQRADEAEQHLRNIAQGGPRADAVQAEIGEMIRQTHELRDQLRRAEAELQQHAEAESADAAAGSYASSSEHAIAHPQPWLHILFTSPDPTTANTSALAIRDHLAAEFPGVGMRITSNAAETGTEPVHIGDQANAEDCPACAGTNPDYPFICPGPDA